MSQTADQIELKEDVIQAGYAQALALLEGFDHTPRLAKPKERSSTERSSGIGTRRRFRSTTPGLVTRSTARPDGVHLVDRVEGVNSDDPLPSVKEARVLRTLRRALAIGDALAEAYADQTGLTAMKAQNLQGALPQNHQVAFSEALTAQSAVGLYGFANALSVLAADLAGDAADVGAVDELLFDNWPLARQGVLWALDQILADVAAEADLGPNVLAFAEQVMDGVALRAASLSGLDAFRNQTYRVEADDLTLAAFTPARATKSAPLTMQFKKPHEVVGNHIAKYQSLRLAKMLMAYDFDRKLNPFAELGGFIFTFMGDGAPGTGKTTLIQMMAGLVNDYCQNAGYPFRYQNFSIDQIDSYQGKSGQNAKAFIKNILDPSVIGFGTIDDIDQIAGKRGDKQSSAGQQEVTAVFMEAFAGANTVVRGNCTFGMFSNYPENVDDALRQRAGARFLVDGPQSQDDYIDILALLLGKKHDIPLGDHDLFEAQALQRAVAASFEKHGRPQEEGLRVVWDQTERQIGTLDTTAKLGAYLKAIQEADPRFTGRAIKNITDAVKVRAMDFELPDEWMESPDLFLFQPYDAKSAMINDLRRPITVDMVVQEINRYADSEFRYADKSDEVAIENAVRDMGRMEEAKRRYLAGRSE